MAVYSARLLGTGSSGGVPRVDGDWGACDPTEPKNRRLRCSLLVETAPSLNALYAGQATRLVIDTSPDFRQQMLEAGSPQLHALIYTHTHADQAHGIDDVRALVYQRREKLDTFMSPETSRDLQTRFDYIFQTPEHSSYPPLLNAHIIKPDEDISCTGPGGELNARLFDVEHGSMPCSGVQIGPFIYTPDVKGLDASAKAIISNHPIWIVDALRQTPHPSHAHLAMTLDWISALRPHHSVLTNLHIDMDYRTLCETLPKGVRAGFDGLTLIYDDSQNTLLHIDPE